MAINFDPNKLNQFFDQQFGKGSFNTGVQQASNAARLKTMAGFAKSDALKRLKAMQAKAKKDQEYMDKYGMSYADYQAKKEQDKLNKLQDKYQVLDNGLTSDQASKMRAKGDAEGRGGHQPSYDQQRKEAQKNAKDKGKTLSDYDTSKMTEHNQEMLNKQSAKSKSNQKGMMDKAKDFFTSKDVNGDGQRDGLLGLADRFILPISQAADEVLFPGNEEQQRKTELAKYGKIKNPAMKAGMIDRGTESKVLHGIGTALGYVAPYEGGYGAVNAALTKLPKAAQKLSKANPYVQRAIKGGLAGLAAETGLAGANELVNPNAANMNDYAKRIALGTAGGMIGDPLLHGIAKNLNLKGQLNQVMHGTGSAPYNPVAFENALKETFPTSTPKGNNPLLMSLNPNKTAPNAAEEAITQAIQQPAEAFKLKTVKTGKNITEMSPAEIEDVWHQLNERHQKLIEQGADERHLNAINEDLNKVTDLLLKLDLQMFGAPQARAIGPKIAPVQVEHVPTPMELELQKIKDIKPFQVGTQNIYEIADRLPKEMGDRIKNALDNAKSNHTSHLEQSANDLYDKVVYGLGIKKGSKESALVQDFGEKTLAKQFLERHNIDPAIIPEREMGKLNLEELQRLSPNKWKDIVEADKYFRQNYDDLLNQVNKVRAQVYPTNPEKIVPKRADYYHHFNELTGLEGLKNLFDTPANIDPHLEGISPNTKPNSKWQAFMQKRGMGPYKSDAVGGYLTYLKASSHSIHLDPVIRELRNASKTVADATEYTKNANKIVQSLQMHANDLAGKTSEYDRMSQLVVGRKGMKIINNLNARVKSNMILGNLGSTLGQLGNLPLGIAKAKFHAVPGAKDTLGQLVNWITKGEKNAPINKSSFLKERFIDKNFRKFDAKLLDKPKNAAVWMLETADKAQTSLIWHSMYRKALSKKVTDPIKFADYETRKIIAGRGVGEVPLLQKAKTTQLLTPFTLEVANQWKVLSNMVGAKDAGGIITFLVASAAINAGMEKIKGSEASYDPIGALIDGYAKKDGTTAQKVLGALASLNGETIGNIPGGNYIPQLMGMVNDKQKEALFGDRSPDRFGTGLGVASTVFKPANDIFSGNFKQAGKDLLPIILPYGGNQIKKTAGGIEALNKGGAYDSKGELQYPVDTGNPSDLLHSLTFGPTTTASGQDYYYNNRKPLSAKQTSQVQNSSNPKETYNMVREKANIKSIQKKIDSVKKDRRLSPAAKQAMIKRLMEQMPAN